MSDLYADIINLPDDIANQIASVLELRATDPQQQSMSTSLLKDLGTLDNAKVLEIGCGTGAIARKIAIWPGVAETVGLDPSPIFVNQACNLGKEIKSLRFVLGDGTDVPFSDESFDVVIFHTTLCHIPDSQSALLEAYRVLRNNGQLLIFDGDYSSITFSIDNNDPLQICAQEAQSIISHDSFLIQTLSKKVTDIGFFVIKQRSFGYISENDSHYLLTVLDRGADSLLKRGIVSTFLAKALKDEARYRLKNGNFFGRIVYGSILARKQP